MRVKNILRNFATGFTQYIAKELLRFIVRTIFIYTLSKSFLGISSLFSSVLNILNIAELGIGTAISFALYKPLAVQDIEQIKSLMDLFKKSYRIIGLSILAVGLALMPFLPYIIKITVEQVNIYYIYILYLVNSVSSYFFFSYKSILLTADQKKYIVDRVSIIVTFAVSLCQIAILFFLRSSPITAFYLYTATNIVLTILGNIVIAKKVDRMYPYLKEKNINLIERDIWKQIVKNVKALSIARVSRVALDSIDAVVISAVVINGVGVVGMYSNYTLLVSGIVAFFSIISSALSASLGNFLVTEDIERSKNMFNGLNLLFSWMYGFCAICLWVLLNPFIGGVWLTTEWLLSDTAVFLIVVNFLLDGLMSAPIKFIQAAGLYWQARFRYILSAFINITLSVLFVVVFKWGIEGVLFATTIAKAAMISLDPYVLYKYFFKSSSIKYYVKFIVTLCFVLLTGTLVRFMLSLVYPAYSVISVAIGALLCILVPNALFYMALHRTEDYVFARESILGYISSLRMTQTTKGRK